MSKSDVTQEQARALIDRIAQELGLLVSDTSGFIKVQGPTNKHRIYVQKSRTLNRIDCTVPLQSDDPAYKPLSAPNGSIACNVQPDLTQLERVLRMLGDSSLGTQTPNKPRPFAPTKAPAARKPKPVAEPVPEARLEPVPKGGSLQDRLARIRESARNARIRRLMEDPDKYGQLTEEEAASIVDGKVSLEEYAANHQAAAANALGETLLETGIRLDMN